MSETIEMPQWQSRLIESYSANSVKLYNLRERHWRIIVEYRDRYTVGSPAYVQTSDYLAKLRNDITDLVEQMRFTQLLFSVGPIVGDAMALPLGYPSNGSRTLIQIIEEERYKLARCEDVMYNDKIEGIDLALDILRNPKKYLTDAEKNDWAVAVASANSVSRPVGVKTQDVDVSRRKPVKEPSLNEVKASSVTVVRRKKEA